MSKRSEKRQAKAALQTLVGAERKLNNGANWARGKYKVRIGGKLQGQDHYCIVGAVQEANGEGAPYLLEAIREEVADYSKIEVWNDVYARTWPEVAKLLQTVRTKLEAKSEKSEKSEKKAAA